ncbi:MAG: TIGR03936 family radical SAM-associated protein [Gudongella sp.]|nr:TIGR03936 family radical SAM-associated protein [Gudongella sp.]
MIRTRFNKIGYLKYLSHLDLVRLFTRSFSMADLPVKYTEGFNPHPRFSIGNPLPLGTESEAEYMDIDFDIDISAEEVKVRLNSVLPEGIKIIDASESFDSSSLSSSVSWSLYEMRLKISGMKPENEDIMIEKLKSWEDKKEVYIDKRKKKGKGKTFVKVDIVPLIREIEFRGFDEEGFFVIDAILKTGEGGNLRPAELISAIERDIELGIDVELTQIKRIEAFVEDNGELRKPI